MGVQVHTVVGLFRVQVHTVVGLFRVQVRRDPDSYCVYKLCIKYLPHVVLNTSLDYCFPVLLHFTRVRVCVCVCVCMYGTHPVSRMDQRFLFGAQFVEEVESHLHTPGPKLTWRTHTDTHTHTNTHTHTHTCMRTHTNTHPHMHTHTRQTTTTILT